jgi:hypothetical protein
MSAPIEEAWVEKHSTKHQKQYWYNTATGESTWVRPVTSQAGGQPDSNQPPPKRVRLENESIGATAVVTSSYKPPVSGSAEDAILIRARDLPPPRIVTDLPPSTQSMWERSDIMVNDYLAATYKSGSIVDSKGVTQKFKDITNPIQGRHLYNLVTENKFTRTLEVGLAMGTLCFINIYMIRCLINHLPFQVPVPSGSRKLIEMLAKAAPITQSIRTKQSNTKTWVKCLSGAVGSPII